MSIKLLDPSPALVSEGCPEYVIDDALRTKRKVAKIVWDDEGTPDHCKGFIQWSTRPYQVTDQCDGTRDSNAMLVCLTFCERTGLDLEAIYQRAYSDECRNFFSSAKYLAHLDALRGETEIPDTSEQTIIQLLNSLSSMNWHSLVAELAAEWSCNGFDVSEYWKRER